MLSFALNPIAVVARSWSRLHRLRGWAPALALLAACSSGDAWSQTNCAQDPTSGECEIVQPPVCSRDPAASTASAQACEVTSPPGVTAHKRVQVNLTARTAAITVGGFLVTTKNYNGSYLSPVVEALPADTVAARLENSLAPRTPADAQPAHAGHGDTANDNPTNLHYFHGGIVTPRNARRDNDPNDDAASLGNGDNIFVYRKPGSGPFMYEVPIPSALDARVLEGNGVIPHPNGLNWYHSHLHGLSSDQVMGGLSGLLSVGDAKANVVACKQEAGRCVADPAATAALKARTDVRYAMLRDLALKDISALPDAPGAKTANWAPEDKHWRQADGACDVWTSPGGQRQSDAKLRKGYCQRAKDKAWLFTLNGQRFPTITVEGGRNLLLRLGNLSSNVTYWLELYNEADDNDKLPLRLLSIDGVVPAATVTGGASPGLPAVPVNDLIFLPASRAELYIRNDCQSTQDKTYVLRTKELRAGNTDRWPEVQLARIKLQKSSVSCADEIALNATTSRVQLTTFGVGPLSAAVKPVGCVDDIDPSKREHRRAIFKPSGLTTDGRTTDWSILTEIRRPQDPAATAAARPYGEFLVDTSKTVGIADAGEPDGFRSMPFEEYDLGDGKIDWANPAKPHVCVFVDFSDPQRTGSSKQLWVLDNETAALHNFHIHQMKFRLATAAELTDTFKIDLTGEPAQPCPAQPSPCYKRYETGPVDERTRWHDTIPMPPGKVYIIMSFTAEEQIGRYVFHCHILKHEDTGLMAPIEVWGAK